MLRCEAVRWVDGSGFPGSFEVVFIDADGVRRSIVDKVPVLMTRIEFGRKARSRCQSRSAARSLLRPAVKHATC